MKTYGISVHGEWNGEMELLGTFEVAAATVQQAMDQATRNAAYQFGYSSPDQLVANCC